MSPPDPDAFAALLCDWCLEVQPGQQILIGTSTLGTEPALAMHRAVLERDAWPILRLSPPEITEDFYRHASERHLDGFAPLELLEIQSVDSVLRIDAPGNTRALAGIEPELVARATRARAVVQETRLSKRWCGSLWPTPALAQQAAMGAREYAGFVERALFLDRPDPLGAWRSLSAGQSELVERLAAAREIRIEADGTDLRLSVEGRTWINSDGRRNMPSGEVFTGPLERSANGHVRFTIPSNPRGVEVSGIELEFRDGEVVSARAAHGQLYLEAALATDPGARYLGEIGIGTNSGIDRPTGLLLFDEKMAGTVHLALGRSYPETGGQNSSALHWDMICDLRSGGRITADGEPLALVQ